MVGACGDDAADQADAGYPPVTTAHCEYTPVPPTGGAGGSVTASPLEAGAAEAVLDLPIGTALGAYTARAGFLGTAGKVDLRKVELPGAFNPSIGIETAPRVRALALRAGGETVLLLKVDLGYTYEAYAFELAERLGPEFAGKILITASHSHSCWGQHSGHDGIGGVGSGRRRQLVTDRTLDTYEDVARAALAALRPARLGVFVDENFDPEDEITRDRRGENDALSGGSRDDAMLFMIRVDGQDGVPIAAVPVFGMHGTLQEEDNSFASTDAPGAVERMLEEQFDTAVVVMHLQGAVGDVSPKGHGDLDCASPPGGEDDPCWRWLKNEGNGRAAAPVLYAAWQAAGAAMADELALEMLTRSVPLGPDPQTFAVRAGALRYAAWDRYTPADRVIWDDQGLLVSPVDEFNAPVGAARCEKDDPLFPAGLMPGVDMLPPYGSCVTIDVAGEILGELLGLDIQSAMDRPVCQSTRTSVTALRLGDFVLAALPGEVTTLYADLVREKSPVAADRTLVLSFGNGHVGYLLTPEDWLLGGYESSINFWGPLEAEYLAERAGELMALAVTDTREDGAAGGVDRFVTAAVDDSDLVIDEPAPMAGTPPAEVPDRVWSRTGTPSSAQPAGSILRVSGLARFTWIGDDPLVSTPVVTLEVETAPGGGEYAPVVRRSGRPVRDGDLLLAYTPIPLRREGSEPRTHLYVAEWQAVPWVGAPGLDALSARAGVPLRRYRFHVASASYELTSDPFQVAPAILLVTASRAGTLIEAAVTIHAPLGYRLLHTTLPSNQPVPLASGEFDVELGLAAGGKLTFAGVVGDADGKVSVDAGSDVADVVSIELIDAFGNAGSASL
jgi:neutral ceramidase